MTRTERLNHPLVLLADKIAAEVHPEQFRTSPSTSYMPHFRRLARLVATFDAVDEVDVASAFLHDVIEDSLLTAPTLADLLLASGADPVAVDRTVGLVRELTQPHRSDNGLRRNEKRLKTKEMLKRMSDRAKRIKLADYLDVLINGEPMPSADLSDYLSEIESAVDIAGDVDAPLAGWLLHEIDKYRIRERKED